MTCVPPVWSSCKWSKSDRGGSQNITKSLGVERRRLVWARNMLLDVDLFAKAETEILNHLTDRGYEIFYISGHSEQKFRFKNPNIRLFSIPLGRNNYPLKYHLILGLVQLLYFPIRITKTRPNFVIVDWDSLFGLLPMLPFCKLLGAKVILDIRSTPIPIENLQKRTGLRLGLLKFVFSISVYIAKRKLDGITIITNLMKKEVCETFNIDPTRVGVWPSGVSTRLFNFEDYTQERTKIKEQLELSDKFIICYHGSFLQSRGLLDAIDAMVIVKDQYPEAVLFLLGKGSIQTVADMRKTIETNGLQGRVIIHDPVNYEDLPRYIAMCDVGLVPLPDLPQWRNQCPLKLLEYLSMEKVAILSDIPCNREVVGTDPCGIYLKSTSDVGIAEGITFAIRNKNKLGEWGARGRAIVEKKYTWGKVAQDLDIYLRQLENKGIRLAEAEISN